MRNIDVERRKREGGKKKERRKKGEGGGHGILSTLDQIE